MPSRLSPQGLCDNSCIYYAAHAHLGFIRFEHSVCCGSLRTTYIYICICIYYYILYIYIYIFIYDCWLIYSDTKCAKLEQTLKWQLIKKLNFPGILFRVQSSMFFILIRYIFLFSLKCKPNVLQNTEYQNIGNLKISKN